MERSRARRVEAFNLKSGPTQSGGPPQPPPNPSQPVGGEMFGADKLSVFLSNYWVLVALLLLLPVALILYKKRSMTLRVFSPVLSRF